MKNNRIIKSCVSLENLSSINAFFYFHDYTSKLQQTYLELNLLLTSHCWSNMTPGV